MEDGGFNKLFVWVLFFDSKGCFWIGIYKGFWLFDCEMNRGKKIYFKVFGLQNLFFFYICVMVEIDDYMFWLGIVNYGICKVINENELQIGYEKKYGMVENFVCLLLVLFDGNLYVGYMIGLVVFFFGQDVIIYVYIIWDGLCSNFIGCMIEDVDG